MIRMAILFILLVSTAAQAGSPMEDQLLAMRKSYINEKGYNYELANRCGESQESLAKMEAIFLKDLEDMKSGKASDDAKLMKFYEEGKKAGDEAFVELGSSALESATCKRAIEVAQCKRVLGC